MGFSLKNEYELIDAGHEMKLERFGKHVALRPCGQAIWAPRASERWDEASYVFSREGKNIWKKRGKDDSWVVDFLGLKMRVEPTDFGHLGFFPEHQHLWREIEEDIEAAGGKFRFLNLFAYTGAATLAAARAGAEVCHVDASKKSVAWASENAQLSGLKDRPIRWIIDDVMKFMKREVKREKRYEGILLDPPSFGRGAQGQVFKIERDLLPLLEMCKELLQGTGRFLYVSCHTPGITPLVLRELTEQALGGKIECGEMALKSSSGIDVPFGSFAKWRG